jgi:hypothetical protein
VALHKGRREEFMRRVQTILGKYPRLSGLQSRIKNAKLLEGLESKGTGVHVPSSADEEQKLVKEPYAQ